MKVKTRSSGTPQANRIFTDREEPRRSFWKNYNAYKEIIKNGDNEIKVLSYYGIGGIGKSTLLKKLISELTEQVSAPKYVYFDFNIKQDSKSVLESIKNILSNDYKFSFPLFDLALYNYAQKIGDNVATPEIKAFTDKSPLLDFALTAAGSLPVIGIIPQLMVCADKGAAFIRTMIENHKRDIIDIENKSPAELYAHLPYLFAQDLADNLENATDPLVVFFDTYEQLVNEMSAIGEPLNNDEWLRGENGLIQNIPNVLWVIAGREKLKWERFDQGWSDSLEQHILGSLSKTDGTRFLEAAGINRAELRDELYELTQGTPVYLDLCVDRYINLVKDGINPQITDFGNDIYALIERFARYMDDSRKDIVYILSCLNIWNDDMIISIGGKVLPSFTVSCYDKVKDFSFITTTSEGLYNIHKTVSAVLFSNCPEVIKKSTLKFASEYCKNQIGATFVNSPEYSFYMIQYITFSFAQIGPDAYISFYNDELNDKVSELCGKGQFEISEKILDLIFSYIENTETELYAWFMKKSVQVSIYKGEYSVAFKNAQRCCEIYSLKTDELDKEYLEAQLLLAITYKWNGKYAKSLSIMNDILEKYKSVSEEESDEVLRVKSEITFVLDKIGHYSESFDLGNEIYLSFVGKYGENDIRTVKVLVGIANSLFYSGKYENALEKYRTVYEKRKEILGEKHPDTVSAMRNISSTLQSLGKYEEAFEIRKQVYEKWKEILGEDHPDTVSAMINISGTLQSLGKYEEAFEIQKQVYEKRKEILGEDHPDTVSAMRNISNALESLGKYEEALEIRKQVYEKRKEILGEDHPQTISALNGIAWTCHFIGNTDEGLTCIKKALDMLQNTNLSIIKKISYTDTLAYLYDDNGETDKAIELADEMLLLTQKEYPDNLSFLSNRYYACAMFRFHSGGYLNAKKYADEAFRLRKESLGEYHRETISAKELIDDIIKKMEE